jgi:hypothetical protein
MAQRSGNARRKVNGLRRDDLFTISKVSPASRHDAAERFCNERLLLERCMKAELSLDEIKQIALAKIREHRGCHDVEDVSICPIANEAPDPNWAISCGVGGSNMAAAAKAALYVEQEMQGKYQLLAGG